MLPVVSYRTRSGGEVVRNCLKSFSSSDRKILGEDLMVVQVSFPVGPPICAPLSQGLWEVRSTLPGHREVRMIFFHDTKAAMLVIVRVFQKKTKRTPQREIKIALARKGEFSP